MHELEAPGRAQLAAALAGLVELSERSQQEIVQKFQPRHVSANGYLIQAGHVCNGIGFVVGGRLFSESAEGREASCDIFCKGDFVTDYVSFLTQAPSKVHISADVDTTLLWIPRAALQELYAHTEGAERVGRIIAERQYVSLVRRTSELLTRSPGERYEALVRDPPAWLDQVPQYIVARWLGITPESLSRIRNRVGHSIKMAASIAVPSKSKAPSSKSGGPKLPRAPLENP